MESREEIVNQAYVDAVSYITDEEVAKQRLKKYKEESKPGKTLLREQEMTFKNIKQVPVIFMEYKYGYENTVSGFDIKMKIFGELEQSHFYFNELVSAARNYMGWSACNKNGRTIYNAVLRDCTSEKLYEILVHEFFHSLTRYIDCSRYTSHRDVQLKAMHSFNAKFKIKPSTKIGYSGDRKILHELSTIYSSMQNYMLKKMNIERGKITENDLIFVLKNMNFGYGVYEKHNKIDYKGLSKLMNTFW